MTGPLLSIRDVSAYYGSIAALKGIDVEVMPGEIVTIIGANGAGKSTLMMTICGNPQARTGNIVFEGRDITRLPTHEIMRMKIAQSPEGRRIFPRMTVFENLQMGAATPRAGISGAILRASMRSFQFWRAGATSAAVRCRAASSRCFRSAAR